MRASPETEPALGLFVVAAPPEMKKLSVARSVYGEEGPLPGFRNGQDFVIVLPAHEPPLSSVSGPYLSPVLMSTEQDEWKKNCLPSPVVKYTSGCGNEDMTNV